MQPEERAIMTTPTVRLTATVDREIGEEVKRLADGMGTSVTRLLGTLITIAVRSTGSTFDAFANTIEGLTAADAEHDRE